MKASEIRGMALNEAEEKMNALKAELAKERAVLASGTKPENPGKTRALRRNIARILTIMGEKKKAGEKTAEKKIVPAKEPGKKSEAKKEKIVQKKEVEKKIKKNEKISKKK
jgi:ribosomal protein L29